MLRMSKLACVVMLASAMVLSAVEEPKKLTFKEEFQSLEKEYDTAMDEYKKLQKEAKTPAERAKVLALNPTPKFADRYLALAEKDLKDPQAIDCLVWVLTHTTTRTKPGTRGMELIRDFTTSDKIGPVCLAISRNTDSAIEQLLRDILKNNKHKDTQGMASYGLATYLKSASDLAERIADNEDLRGRVEKSLGEKTVKSLLAMDRKAVEKERVSLLETVAAKYSDVTVRKTTLGKAVEGELFEVRYLQVGMKAPNAEAVDLDGKKTSLDQYKGKVVMLDFWATWCGPCRVMIPHEREMVERLKDKPFALISISADDEKDTVSKFLEKTPMPWVHWWAGDQGDTEKNQTVVRGWNIRAFPTMYIIDAKGVIRHKYIGSPGNETLDKVIDKLVEEAQK